MTDLNKLGEVTSRLKELEVTLEFAEISKQRAEGEATLAKERAESASREVKRLELLVLSAVPCYNCGLGSHFFRVCNVYHKWYYGRMFPH